jgi:hypothetical protein
VIKSDNTIRTYAIILRNLREIIDKYDDKI